MSPQTNSTKSTIQTPISLCHDSVCVLDRKSCEEPSDTKSAEARQRSFQSLDSHKITKAPFRDSGSTPLENENIYLCYWKVSLFPFVKERKRKLLGQRCHIMIMIRTEKQKLESCNSWNDQVSLGELGKYRACTEITVIRSIVSRRGRTQ